MSMSGIFYQNKSTDILIYTSTADFNRFDEMQSSTLVKAQINEARRGLDGIIKISSHPSSCSRDCFSREKIEYFMKHPE
jgi:succinyl-CoA synthetase beta subunit